MDLENEKKLAEKRAGIIKALGHPSRLLMVSLLSTKDWSVNELTEVVGSDVSTVSKHLLLLKQQGILVSRKVGKQVLYTLVCPCIMEFIHCIDDVIYQDAERGIGCVLPGAKITTS